MKRYIRGHRVEVKKSNIVKAWGKLFSNTRNHMIFRFSTSIANFAERVKDRHDVEEWHPIKSLFKPTVFVGLYHGGDILRGVFHFGPKLFFYCGGDCLFLQKHPFWQWLIRQVKADHVCENEIEQKALQKMGFGAKIHPILFFDDWKKYPLSFKPSKKPHVWLTCHPGREREYGVDLVEEIARKVPEVTFHIFGIEYPRPDTSTSNWSNADGNIIYHGQLPSEQLDKMIRGYHAGLRTCAFDGCPHTVSKGALLGQYPINFIKYPHTWNYQTKEQLVKLLKKLKTIKKPNLPGRKHWIKTVSQFPWQ